MTNLQRYPVLVLMLALSHLLAAPAAAQQNNLKQIGLATLQVAPDAGITAVPAGRHEVQLLSDGTSNTIMLSDQTARAVLRGCPADIAERGFGEAAARARALADGAAGVVLASRRYQGCTASATFAGKAIVTAVQHAVAPAGREPEPDGGRIPAHVQQAYRAFWSGLTAADAAALERRLAELEARTRRGANVDRELADARRDFPQLFELATSLQREPWHIVGSAGADEGSVECSGIGWIGVNGKVRCIGKLVVKD